MKDAGEMEKRGWNIELPSKRKLAAITDDNFGLCIMAYIEMSGDRGRDRVGETDDKVVSGCQGGRLMRGYQT